jgi:hypothetical protein
MRQRGLKQILNIALVVVIAGVVGGYSYLEVRSLLQGPEIVLESPYNGATVLEPILNLTGAVKNAQVIALNGRDLFVDEAGTFTEAHLLHPGHNTLILRAQDRFENEIVKELEVIYKP